MTLQNALLAGAATIALSSWAGGASAQAQTTAQPSNTIAEVVVTARKKSESLQKIPVAVSALTGTQLTQQGIRETTDLGKIVPSLTVSFSPINANTSQANAAIFSLRGQSAGDALLTFSEPVGVYEDSVNVPHPDGLNGAFVDIQRVEVLKGPQGTLYGRNTTGGAVNIITRGADYKGYHGYASAEVGNYDDWKVGGAVNLPIINDVLAARVAYQHWNRQGYGNDPVTGQHPGQDHDDDVVRLSVRFDPLSNLTSSTKVEFINMDQVGYLQTLVGLPTGGGAAAAEAGFEANPGLARNVGNFGTALAAGIPLLNHWINAGMFTVGSEDHLSDKVKTWHVAEDVTWNIDADTKLRSISGYHYVKDSPTTDLDGTPYQILEIFAGQGGTQPNFGGLPYPHTPFPELEYHQYTQEFNLSGQSFGNLDWLVGAFGSWEHGYGGEPYIPFGAIEAAPPPLGLGGAFVSTTTESSGEDTDTWAFFTQNDFHVSERVTVTFGARYTEEKQTNNALNYNWIGGNYSCVNGALANMAAPSNNPANCSVLNQHEKANGISYLLSFNYQITPATLLYIKTSRGFRGGALQFRAPGFPAARPEFATDYEFGFKSDFLEHRLRTNLAVYHTNYSNKQEQAITTVCGTAVVAAGSLVCPDGSTPHSSTILTNAGTATVDGAEAEITATPIDGLTITESTTYLFGKYTSFKGALDPDGNVVDGTGTLFQDPTWRYSIGARYEHEFGPGLLAGSLDWSYRSANHLSAVNISPSFPLALQQRLNQDVGLLDGRIDYNMPRQGLTMALWATNLLNKNYQTEALFSAALGIATASTQPPRMYGFTITKSFGGG